MNNIVGMKGQTYIFKGRRVTIKDIFQLDGQIVFRPKEGEDIKVDKSLLHGFIKHFKPVDHNGQEAVSEPEFKENLDRVIAAGNPSNKSNQKPQTPASENQKPITGKKCVSCGERKQPDQFEQDGRTVDGLSKTCVDCSGKGEKANDETNDVIPIEQSYKFANEQLFHLSESVSSEHVDSSIEAELMAMGRIANALELLDDDAQTRVLDWVIKKLNIQPPEAANA